MDNKKNKKSGFWQRLLAKYRFVILNEETFEERVSYKLSRLNVFLAVGIIIVLLIATTFLVISRTSLKEYIPGYDSSEIRRQAIRNNYRLDSLQGALLRNQRYISSVNKVLRGDLDLQELETQMQLDTTQIDYAACSSSKRSSIAYWIFTLVPEKTMVSNWSRKLGSSIPLASAMSRIGNFLSIF